jgi:negative regulator of flagellin synthesis FlgM
MNIKLINSGNVSYISNVETKKTNNKEAEKLGDTVEKSGDKLEISKEALEIKQSSNEMNKLDVIKSKIQSKFYDSDEVLNKVADKILKEF